MDEHPTMKEIRRLVKDTIDKIPKAGLRGQEWETLRDIADFCFIIEFMAAERAYTTEELERFLDQVKLHHKFVDDTVKKKRRTFPSRSKRKWL